MTPPPLEIIRLGTRGSELALAQADLATAALQAAWPGLEIRREIIKTTGDLRQDIKLSEFNRGDNPVDKGIFTKELEQALRDGRIDVAVHSLKDVPTELGPGFAIAAVLPRAPVEDVLVTKSPGGLAALPQHAVIASSSVRRARQMQRMRPDVRIEDIRGNVPTRLAKLAENEKLSGILLAQAGLVRLGLFQAELPFRGHRLFLETLDPERFLPAASQGAVGLEIFGENPALSQALAAVNHLPTFTCIRAERHFLHLLQAGCQTPVGLLSRLQANGDLRLSAAVYSESDPTRPPSLAECSGPSAHPEGVAAALYAKIRATD